VTDNELLYLESIHLFVEVRQSGAAQWQVPGGRGCGNGTAASSGISWLCSACTECPTRGVQHIRGPLGLSPKSIFTGFTLDSRDALAQILDEYFGNVCELDLVFGFHKV
jgi:hypothetical protein